MLPPAPEPPVLIAQAEMPPPLLRGSAPPPVARGTFAPRTDITYRQRLEQERVVAGETARYIAERRVRFTREAGGFRVDMTLIAVDGGIGSRAGAMFEAGLRGLLRRPLVFHLDPNGAITSLEGATSHWTAYLDGLAGQPMSGPDADARRARLAELTAPMRALPPERQLQVLGSALREVIDPLAASRAGAAPRAFSREVRSPLGGMATLDGSVRAVRDSTGIVVEEESAAGVLTASGTNVSGEMQVSETRRIDPASGLITSRVRRERIVIPAGGSIITTRTTLRPE